MNGGADMFGTYVVSVVGESRKEADDKLKLVLRILDMPASTASSLLSMIEGLVGEDRGSGQPSR